jgi:MFS family permease
MSFAIRGDIMGSLEHQFGLTKTQLGTIAGTAFWGFTLSIFIGGQLCDVFGMKRILSFAFICHVAGCLVTIFAGGFWMLFGGTLLIGLANGFVEGAINPLVATIYKENKTAKLNGLHAWFPGGIVIGGLLCFAFAKMPGFPTTALGWQIKMATILVPTIIYGLLFIGLKFPETERVQSGVSTKQMYKEALRPLFIIWVLCMLMTGSTELGPEQWIPNVLSVTAHVPGILILVWITGLMAVGRMVAGPVVHKLSPLGLLICSAILSGAGLLAMSYATSAVTVCAAATVFALGVCYFWPTMLGVTSERFPKGGALLLGIMGAAGMLATSILLPVMGRINDNYTLAALNPDATKAIVTKAVDSKVPGADALLRNLETKAIKELPAGKVLGVMYGAQAAKIEGADELVNTAAAKGGAMSFRYVVILPCILVLVFIGVFLSDKAKGGYKVVKLEETAKEEAKV